MKVLVIVAVACLLSGANAGAFTDTLKTLGQGFTSVFTDLAANLKDPLTNVANQLISNLKQAGTQLLTTGATSLLGSFSHLGETPTVATRDLSLLNGVTKFIDQGKQIVGKLAENLGGLYHSAMTHLSQIAQRISSMDFLKEPLSKILGEIRDVVDIHSILQGSILKTLSSNPGQFLIKAAESLVGQLSHKRGALFDNLSALGQQFVDLFKPTVDAVAQHVQVLGNQLSQTATNLFTAVQPALGQLGQDLLGHVTALKSSAHELLTQGTDVFKTLKDAA